MNKNTRSRQLDETHPEADKLIQHEANTSDTHKDVSMSSSAEENLVILKQKESTERKRERRSTQTDERKKTEAERSRKRRIELSKNTVVFEQHKRKDAKRKSQRRAEMGAEQIETEAERSRKRRLDLSCHNQNNVDIRDRERQRSSKRRKHLLEKKKNNLAQENVMFHNGWRTLNQYKLPSSEQQKEAVRRLADAYKSDLEEFRSETSSILKYKMCSICGIRKEVKKCLPDTDRLFDCLRQLPNPFPSPTVYSSVPYSRPWWKFPIPSRDLSPECNHSVTFVCAVCHKSLSSQIVPLMSRACYPIKVHGIPDFVNDLSHLEQALTSHVLPMILVFQHHGSSGQFKSYGQSIALENDIERIAKVLPRKPSAVCLTLADKRGVFHKIRPHLIRKTLEYFQSIEHPGYVGIKFSEENFSLLSKEVENDKAACEAHISDNMTKSTRSETDTLHVSNNVEAEIDTDALKRLLDAGQNQRVENETATACGNTPVGTEPLQYTKVLREAAFEVLSRSSAREIHRSHVTENWELKFPFLLPDGRGGPNACTDPVRKLNLQEWIKYVIQVEDLDFSTNILFILYANNVVRRRKITGLACNKTISAGVRDAMEELYKVVHQNIQPENVEQHHTAVQALLNRISYHTNDVTGSIQDKSVHRQNILSMYNDERHGAPQLFLTLSAAENIVLKDSGHRIARSQTRISIRC